MATLGFGAQFLVGDGADPEVFTAVAEAREIVPPAVRRQVVETTNQQSPDQFQEYEPGLRDPGEAVLVLNYTADAYDALLAQYMSNDLVNYRVNSPTGHYWAFRGFVSELGVDTPIDDVMVINCTVKVSGQTTHQVIPPPPPPPLPFDINLVLISGQSNSEDADSVPIINRTGSDGVIMLDTTRPRHWTGPFGSAFSTAIGAEYIAAANHWGGDMAPAVGEMIQQLIAAEDGQTFATHGQRILPVHIGQSSSSVSEISHGTAVFTAVMAHLAAVKAAADAEGLTVGIVAGAWLWGADGYDDNIGKTQWKSDVDGYWTIGGDVDVYLSGIFGQTGEEFPVGFMQTHAHGPRGFGANPYGAEAECELVEAYERYSIINPEGAYFYNGLERGFAASGVHHAAREAALIGANIGWWVKRLVVDEAAWPSLIPTFTRTSTTKITATFDAVPDGEWGLQGTGLTPTGMQTNYGWFFYDPAAPTTELALSRLPYIDDDSVVFEFTSTLPTNVSVRYGARTSSSSIAGNHTITPAEAITYTVDGTAWPLFRMLPTIDRAVP